MGHSGANLHIAFRFAASRFLFILCAIGLIRPELSKTAFPSFVTDNVYCRLIFASVTRMTTRLPRARAARVMVSSVTDTFPGSRRRSSCERLV